MDVIGAHVRRLPDLDERWTPRAVSDPELLAGLLEGQVAGTATHPLDNVRNNALMLLDGDPDKEFGMPGMAAGMTLDNILALVETAAGAPIDRDARFGPVDIQPEPILAACRAAGSRLGEVRAARGSVVLATGHPVGLAILYHALDLWLREGDARVVRAAHGVRWRDPHLDHDWFVDHWDGVGMLTDGREPRHTHWPAAMERMLEELTPDLVVADHGFAGAAIQAGVETISIADVNDPALLVAKSLGRTEHVIVMDDHVDPAAYWPCFQAIAGSRTV
jgi:hypothetical protein